MDIKRNTWDILMKIPESLSDNEKQQIKEFYDGMGFPKVSSEVKDRKITPFAADAFIYSGIDVDHWSDIAIDYNSRTRHIIEMLDKLFLSFKANGCQTPCVTENFGALLTANKWMECFCSGDVDISADEKERIVICKTLEELGFEQVKRKEYRVTIKQDEYRCPSEFVKDFYVNVVWAPAVREKAYTIDDQKMCLWLDRERYESISYGNTNIRILKPESMLIHCIYHLSVGHYYCASPGVKLLTEVDRIVRQRELEWESIWKQSDEIGITKRVQTALCLSNKILDTPLVIYQGLSHSQEKDIERLVNWFYQENNGEMIVKEPLGLLQRLLIDIISDEGCLSIAAVNKMKYAIKWIITKSA